MQYKNINKPVYWYINYKKKHQREIIIKMVETLTNLKNAKGRIYK